MSNYKSKTPEEAFARSQDQHLNLMHRAGARNAGKTPPHPDYWISEQYHKRVYAIQLKQGRILPKKYRSKIFKQVGDWFERRFVNRNE